MPSLYECIRVCTDFRTSTNYAARLGKRCKPITTPEYSERPSVPREPDTHTHTHTHTEIDARPRQPQAPARRAVPFRGEESARVMSILGCHQLWRANRLLLRVRESQRRRPARAPSVVHCAQVAGRRRRCHPRTDPERCSGRCAGARAGADSVPSEINRRSAPEPRDKSAADERERSLVLLRAPWYEWAGWKAQPGGGRARTGGNRCSYQRF